AVEADAPAGALQPRGDLRWGRLDRTFRARALSSERLGADRRGAKLDRRDDADRPLLASGAARSADAVIAPPQGVFANTGPGQRLAGDHLFSGVVDPVA